MKGTDLLKALAKSVKSGLIDDIEIEGLYSESAQKRGILMDSKPTQSDGEEGDVVYVRTGSAIDSYKKIDGEWFHMGSHSKAGNSVLWRDRRSPGRVSGGSTISIGARVNRTSGGGIYPSAIPEKRDPKIKRKGDSVSDSNLGAAGYPAMSRRRKRGAKVVKVYKDNKWKES